MDQRRRDDVCGTSNVQSPWIVISAVMACSPPTRISELVDNRQVEDEVDLRLGVRHQPLVDEDRQGRDRQHRRRVWERLHCGQGTCTRGSVLAPLPASFSCASVLDMAARRGRPRASEHRGVHKHVRQVVVEVKHRAGLFVRQIKPEASTARAAVAELPGSTRSKWQSPMRLPGGQLHKCLHGASRGGSDR